MNEFTPAQTAQIKSWVDQRDSILKEIAIASDQLNQLTFLNKNLSDSNTEIADKIQQSIGRLNELKKKEDEMADVISIGFSNLRDNKNVLEVVNDSLKEENKILEEKKDNLIKDITFLQSVHDTVFEKVNGLRSFVDGIVKISSENANKVNTMFISASETFQKVIDRGEVNVQKTNMLISDIPKMIVEIHRDIIERKKINKVRASTNHDLSI